MEHQGDKIKSIILSVTFLLIIILLVLLIFTLGFKPERFDNWCLKNGGTIGEIANVTCAISHPNCYKLCHFKCGTINYYDEWEVPKCEVSNE